MNNQEIFLLILVIVIIIMIYHDRKVSKKEKFENNELINCDEYNNWPDCFTKSGFKCMWSNMDVMEGDYCKPVTCDIADSDIRCDQMNQRGFNCVWDNNLETPKCVSA
jgi:hypothetical protein